MQYYILKLVLINLINCLKVDLKVQFLIATQRQSSFICFPLKTFQLTKSLCAQFNEQTVYCKSQSQNDLKHCGVLISLCTSARVPPFHKCPPGYVGVGFCLPPFEKCDVGFCYIEDAFSLQMGQSGVCCLRRKWSEKNIAIKCFSHIIICSF